MHFKVDYRAVPWRKRTWLPLSTQLWIRWEDRRVWSFRERRLWFVTPPWKRPEFHPSRPTGR